jgi:DNA-binding MarR family transcriptional regulator
MSPTALISLDQELPARLRLAVMRLARRLRQQSEEGATPSMLSALASVERLGPVTLSELAQVERVQPPSITKVVTRLEEEGFIARSGDANDRRITRIQLTAKGKRFIEKNRSRKTAYLARGLATLEPGDRDILNKALDVLDRLLKETD